MGIENDCSRSREVSSLLRIFRILPLVPLFALLGGCQMVLLGPSGDVALQQRNLLFASTALMLLIIADAADHCTGDGADDFLRLALPRLGQGQLRSGLAPLAAAGGGDLVGAAADHRRHRRHDLDGHASARSLSTARPDQRRQAGGRGEGRGQRRPQGAARHPGRRTRLEMAVPLPGAGHRLAQRGRGAGRPADRWRRSTSRSNSASLPPR